MGASAVDDDLIGIWKYTLDRIDKQLDIELNLINARMSWLVISESFLFNAFVGAGSDSIKPPGVALAVQAAVVIIGFLIAKFVDSAVGAALSVIEERKEQRTPMEQRLKSLMSVSDKAVDLPSVPRESRWHRQGSIPAHRIPSVLMAGWIILALVWLCRFGWLYGAGVLRP